MQLWFTKQAIQDLKDGKVVSNKFRTYSLRSSTGVTTISDGVNSYVVTDNHMGDFVECIKL